MNPIQVLDEIIERTKYVDDFTDLVAHQDHRVVFNSIAQNEKILTEQATSVGLKINGLKLLVAVLNIADNEVPPEYTERDGENGVKHQILIKNEKILGFGFETINPNIVNKPTITPKKFRVTGNPAAMNLISRLNESIRVLCALRKVNKNIVMKVDAATKLVFSNCYDIGLVYVYADAKYFEKVCVSIRKTIKAAGLDHMIDSEILYRISTKLSPKYMAIKQVVQQGLKSLDPQAVKDNRYKIRNKAGDNLCPFWKTFREEFHNLPLSSRQFIISNLDVNDKVKIGKIKNHLKNYFFKITNPDGKLSDTKRSDFLHKNLYSREKNTIRKANSKLQREIAIESTRKADEKAASKLLLTPVQRKKKNSILILTPPVIRQSRMCLAPLPGPPEKRFKITRPDLTTPVKRQENENNHSLISAIQKRRRTLDSDGNDHGSRFSPLLSNEIIDTTANHPPLNELGCSPIQKEK